MKTTASANRRPRPKRKPQKSAEARLIQREKAHAVQGMRGTLQRMGETIKAASHKPAQVIRKHPMLTTAVALGAAAAVGVAIVHHRRQAQRPQHEESKPSLAGRLFRVARGLAMSALWHNVVEQPVAEAAIETTMNHCAADSAGSAA